MMQFWTLEALFRSNIILETNVKHFCNVWILDESFYRFLSTGKTENVVFPSRCAFCWNPFKFADVLSEKYLEEAKIKSINYGKRWQPLPINFEKFVNWMKRKKRRKKKKKEAWQKKIDWVCLPLIHHLVQSRLTGINISFRILWLENWK